MGRIRQTHRDGWIELDKRASPQRWVARWHTDESYTDAKGKLRYRIGRHQLGFKTGQDLPTLSSAKAKWESVRGQVIHNRKPAVKNLDITLRGFCQEEFIPLRRAGWNDATKDKMEYLFGYLFRAIGDLRITDVTAKHLKYLLEHLATKYSFDTVNGCYVLLRSIFNIAVEEKYVGITDSPTRQLRMPKTRDRDTTICSMEQVQQMEDALSGRDKIIFQVFSRCGTRAGEGFAFQWHDLLPNQTLAVERTYSRGVIKPPKTRKSRKPIALPDSLYQDLMKLKEVAEDPSPAGWIFPSHHTRRRRLANGELEPEAMIRPLDYHNWIQRTLRPAAQKLGIRVNLQIMRRTFATLANDTGANPRDIQAMLRHAKASTTADIYIQPVPRSVRMAVEELDRKIRERSPEELEKQPTSADTVQ
jgi:integrase